MPQKRVKLIDIPETPPDASLHESAALAATEEAASAIRKIGGTLTVRIANRFDPPNRGVVWTFYSRAHDESKRLQQCEVGAWDSHSRLLLVPGRPAVYCRTPVEALAAGIKAIDYVRENGRVIHFPAPATVAPTKRIGRAANATGFPGVHRGNGKPIFDDHNRHDG